MLDAEKRAKVKKQVEFYFSDSNLFRDDFLNNEVKKDADGFVDIALLCIFTRMQGLIGSSAPDASKVADETIAAVADALTDSTTLVLDDAKRRVRRAAPMTKPANEITAEVDGRSLYAGPFPFTTSLDELVALFEGAGDINAVRMRRHMNSKDFKGSVFVEFSTKEEAARVAQLKLEHAGAPLTLEPKTEYVKRKEEERHARPNSPHNPAAAAAAAPRATTAAPKRPREETTEDGAAAATATAPGVEEYVPGCIVHFDFGDEVQFAEPLSFGLVKDSFGGKEKGLNYVEYTAGGKTGCARFQTPVEAGAAMADAVDGKRMVAGYSAAVRILEGDEEREYMVRVAAARAAAGGKDRHGGGGHGGRGRGRGGGRGRGRGRGGGRGRSHGGGKRQRT